MIQASYLVTWERVIFALTTSFIVSSLAYGFQKASLLTFLSIITAHFSGSYGEYYLGGVMGDFLGATICVAEVIMLTSIFLLRDSSFRFQDVIESWTKNQTAMHSIHFLPMSDQVSALVKFIIIMSFITIWCFCVGHPPGFVRESVVAMIDSPENDDGIRIRLDSTAAAATKIAHSGNGEGSSSNTEYSVRSNSNSRSLVEKCFQNPLSTFKERYEAVLAYLDTLAKPVGSLGTLEDWAARLASLQRNCIPLVGDVTCIIFCADHGVAASVQDGGLSCSAYPQVVTRKIAKALTVGAAGAAVFSRLHGASLYVVDVGLAGKDDVPPGDSAVAVSQHKLVGGTKNFCVEPAMSIEQVERCLLAGRQAVDQSLKARRGDVLVFGEVGIGNTTASSAVLAALTGVGIEKLCDGGATVGRTVDEGMIAKKIAIVKQALHLHGDAINKPLLALTKFGGAEIASLTGAILEAGDRNIPVLVDGFIVCTAAAVAAHMSPGVCKVLFFATQSTERGQQIAIECVRRIALEHGIPVPATPAIHMGLRLGEGTGALLSIPILKSAAAVLSDLKTLDEVLRLGLQ
jgi:nicotinate-nucleotide--dimethylbenzimidazole phosphoribosyltransferase